MVEPDILIRLQPKQQLLYMLTMGVPTFIGYGGSRGGAKSGGGRRVLLRRRFDFPGTPGMIFRRTYPELLENHIEPIFREFPIIEQWYNKSEKTITLPNRSRLMFRYGENQDDVKKFLGKEYMDIYVDQAEDLSEIEIAYLRSTARYPGKAVSQCKAIFGFNPGGQGAQYLKRVLIDGKKDASKYKPDERPDDYAFIQAFGWDNIEWVRPYLEAEGISEKTYYTDWSDEQRKECFLTCSVYGRLMNSMPDSLKRGWLYGDFVSFSGQYFDVFDAAKHKVRLETLDLKPWHERWIAMDWGFQHNTAVYWGVKLSNPDVVVVYRELVVHRMDEKDLAKRIVALSEGENISKVFISPDAGQKRGSAKPTVEQIGVELQVKGIPYPIAADNGRVSGWRLVYSMLQGTEQGPKLLIADSCPRLLECLPMMIRDQDSLEDCEKFNCNEQGEGGDDPADALRYLLKSYYRDVDIPPQEKHYQKMKALAEQARNQTEANTMRHIASLKYNAMMQKNATPLGRPVRLH